MGSKQHCFLERRFYEKWLVFFLWYNAAVSGQKNGIFERCHCSVSPSHCLIECVTGIPSILKWPWVQVCWTEPGIISWRWWGRAREDIPRAFLSLAFPFSVWAFFPATVKYDARTVKSKNISQSITMKHSTIKRIRAAWMFCISVGGEDSRVD